MSECERDIAAALVARAPASAPVWRAGLVSRLTLTLFVVTRRLRARPRQVGAVDRARAVLIVPWQAPFGQALLLAAALVHAALGSAAPGGRCDCSTPVRRTSPRAVDPA